MTGSKRWLLTLLVVALVGCLAAGVSAQGESNGTLVVGQPMPGQLAQGQTLNYDYTLSQPSQITLQALGATVAPTITILQNGTPVAQDANTAGAFTVSMTTLLDAGSYVVQVGAANNADGLVVLVLQSENAVTTTALTPGSPVSGTANPLALYSFDALAEPALLYVESSSPDSGVAVRVINTTSGEVSGQIESDLLGARLRLPPGDAAYQVEISSESAPGAFTICLAAVSTGGCEAGSVPAPVATPEVAPTAEFIGCTVTPIGAGNVNVRQSASTIAQVTQTLPPGDVADVIGISPDGQFYNVLYRGTNGWIALSVVTSSGDCSPNTILIINPPPVIPDQGQQQPTQLPIQPPPQPTAPPAQPSTPCIITISSAQLIYTQPNAIPDYIYDQVQAGYQLLPTGRLADNTWWQTSYAGAWIQTSVFGTTASVSGDCSSLPILSAP